MHRRVITIANKIERRRFVCDSDPALRRSTAQAFRPNSA